MKKLKIIVGIIAVLALVASIAVYFAGTKYLSYQAYLDNESALNSPNAQAFQKIDNFIDANCGGDVSRAAVFDIDGTLFGQVPYYLADEALFMHFEKTKSGDGVSDAMWRFVRQPIIDKMIAAQDRSGSEYVQLRIKYLAGMTPDAIEKIGEEAFREKFADKSYEPMKRIVAKLSDCGYQVYGLTASPAYLYRGFISREFGIPKENILGTTGIMKDGIMTAEVHFPVAHGYGKAEIMKRDIKIKPLIVGGNSLGDMEMMQGSVGMIIAVNPDNKKIIGADKTFRGFFEDNARAVIVEIPDIDNGSDYLGRRYGITSN
jgi:phosphoserine phosphatase